MALILNLETATSVCSVALSRDGRTFGSKESSNDQSHATRLTVFIQELLTEQALQVDHLDAISISMGPGSYTGLRIGASVAKGLAYGSGKPLVGVATLQALAHGCSIRYASQIAAVASSSPYRLCPMIDARRMEVYTALYDEKGKEIDPVKSLIIDDQSFNNILDQQPIFFFGNGSTKASAVIRHPNAHFFSGLELAAAYQSELAEELFNRKEFLDMAYFEPRYLKEFIASIPKNKVLG